MNNRFIKRITLFLLIYFSQIVTFYLNSAAAIVKPPTQAVKSLPTDETIDKLLKFIYEAKPTGEIKKDLEKDAEKHIISFFRNTNIAGTLRYPALYPRLLEAIEQIFVQLNSKKNIIRSILNLHPYLVNIKFPMDGYTLPMLAINKGDVELLKLLNRYCPDLSIADRDNQTAFTYHIGVIKSPSGKIVSSEERQKVIKEIKELLQKSLIDYLFFIIKAIPAADKLKDRRPYNKLMEKLKKYLSLAPIDFNIRFPTQDNQSLLMKAFASKDINVFNAVLDKKPLLTEEFLKWATESSLKDKSLTNIKDLLLNLRDKDGNDAFLLAIKNNDKDLFYKMVRLGLDFRMDKNIVNKMGENLLIAAIKYTKDEHYQILNRIIPLGIDVGHQDVNGVTALMAAALTGDPEKVKLVLSLGPDPYTPNKAGQKISDFKLEPTIKIMIDKYIMDNIY